MGISIYWALRSFETMESLVDQNDCVEGREVIPHKCKTHIFKSRIILHNIEA